MTHYLTQETLRETQMQGGGFGPHAYLVQRVLREEHMAGRTVRNEAELLDAVRAYLAKGGRAW